jgi:hypothetical protein
VTTTWRDLTYQLTPAQIAEMEEWESRHPDEQQGLILEARSYAEDNLVSAVMFPHVTPPPDASWLGGWVERSGKWSREFNGTKRELGQFVVTIAGYQHADGTEVRYALVLSSDSEEFTAQDLRAAAAIQIEAADELDRLR